ncbi:hypothetical protein PG991_015959 [Apiospora marii]|uniref:Peptide transporter PTR2 n=1 Tax=Apiospora marii TaxID=335849 RepID=A0ABR1R0C3_9PEZI
MEPEPEPPHATTTTTTMGEKTPSLHEKVEGDGGGGHTPPGDAHAPIYDIAVLNQDYEGKPTEEERATLRRVPGKVPVIAYLLCAVEFCERASYYGCAQIWTNYINRPLPKGGNGMGAVPYGSQANQGALGLGEQIANATTQSFTLLAYLLPLFVGYLADTRFGRYNMIFWGVIVCGVAHVLIVAGGAKALIANDTAKIPFFIGVYILSIGAAMFKPNVTPLLLDQLSSHVPVVKTLKSGERVIEDPEHSTERVMLWFYLLINIGGFMSTATTYCARLVGWWLAFLIPLILYLPLPLLLIWLKPRLILHKPGGSDFPNVFRVIGHCMRRGGVWRIGRKGWWDPATQTYQRAHGLPVETHYPEEFVTDVKRTMQATGMFCIFPVQIWNDQGLGSSANYLSTMLRGDGVPNDVVSNFNSLSIILGGPILNYFFYPLLRKRSIHYGPVARITTGFAIATLGGIGYCVLCYKAYQLSPCGWHGSTDPRCVEEGLVADISLWWEALPTPSAASPSSSSTCRVPYGIAYSRAPINMRGLVSAINLASTAIAQIVNLAATAAITDPHLVWDFGAIAILGAITTVWFYWFFRHIDKEEYVLSTTQVAETSGTRDFLQENDLNESALRPAPIAENEQFGISTKQ